MTSNNNKPTHPVPSHPILPHPLPPRRNIRMHPRDSGRCENPHQGQSVFLWFGVCISNTGLAACGISPAKLLQLEILAASYAGITRSGGGCQNLASRLGYGSTPSFSIILETVTLWLSTVREVLVAGMSEDVRLAWIKARHYIIQRHKCKAFSLPGAMGIMSNVISFPLNPTSFLTAFNVREDPVTGVWAPGDMVDQSFNTLSCSSSLIQIDI